ncbi:MAG: hypothetical protein ACPIOQ_68860, partial [Promethearchaeia archaeon]
ENVGPCVRTLARSSRRTRSLPNKRGGHDKPLGHTFDWGTFGLLRAVCVRVHISPLSTGV